MTHRPPDLLGVRRAGQHVLVERRRARRENGFASSSSGLWAYLGDSEFDFKSDFLVDDQQVVKVSADLPLWQLRRAVARAKRQVAEVIRRDVRRRVKADLVGAA